MKLLLLTLIAVHSMVFANESCTDFLTGNEHVIAKHKSEVRFVTFSPDGKKVITASWDGTAKIIDLTSGQEQTIKGDGPLVSASFSPDNSRVLLAPSIAPIKIIY